jgi:hypothetical protein
MSDDDFRQIVFRGQLNRGEIAKGLDCAKSALRQNPRMANYSVEKPIDNNVVNHRFYYTIVLLFNTFEVMAIAWKIHLLI